MISRTSSTNPNYSQSFIHLINAYVDVFAAATETQGTACKMSNSVQMDRALRAAVLITRFSSTTVRASG